jgi:O-antigen ligase
LVLLAMVSGAKGRRRVGVLTLAGTVVGSAAVYAVLGDGILLLFYGVLDRILSIGTATAVDESVINRFVEARMALQRVWESPIMGHGVGATFGFMDIITDRTWTKTYVHNGYISLWFKLGIVGLGSFLWLWLRTIWDGLKVVRDPHHPPGAERALFVACWCMLVGLLPSFAVSAPLVTSDTTIGFTLLLGVVGGLYDRRVGLGSFGSDNSRLTDATPAENLVA